MALDPRAFPGVSEARLRSSASTPSLRARESVLIPMRMGTPDHSGGNVKVVVRVRGFLPRELERGAECLVEMDPISHETRLLIPNGTDPANQRTRSRKILKEKKFVFDHSFWSHDREDEHYASQTNIYDAVGEEFLNHNFEGYHTCIFAYGQTGSGKSYTMLGTPEEPGIIPRTCEDLFQRIESNESPNDSYTVHVSYFEIYNEHCHDLLIPSRPNFSNSRTSLKIREDIKTGPFLEGLTEMAVKSYSDLLEYMRVGDAARTIASTKMNNTSSRSHAVFTITLKRIQNDVNTDTTVEYLSRIRLVDLAGSERAKATEDSARTARREGTSINLSLTSLGRVISCLADPHHHGPVPYRDSPLTYLLKDSLGGNSRTAMVACISPSDYDETLSTLRYADQAKNIRTRAVVNQDSVSSAERDARIRELEHTIQQLTLQVKLAESESAARETARKVGANPPTSSTPIETTQAQEKRKDHWEEYQKKIERIQRLKEEEKLVAESKIRQLMEQNETLRRHLQLALDSLKNPIELPRSTKFTASDPTLTHPAQDLDTALGKENQPPFDPNFESESEFNSKSKSPLQPTKPIHEQPRIGTAPRTPTSTEPWDQKRSEEAHDLQAAMQDLLSDLGLFKQKMASDRHTFRALRSGPGIDAQSDGNEHSAAVPRSRRPLAGIRHF